MAVWPQAAAVLGVPTALLGQPAQWTPMAPGTTPPSQGQLNWDVGLICSYH